MYSRAKESYASGDITDCGVPFQATTINAGMIFWQDGSGKNHCLFGINTNADFQFIHVNLNDAVSYAIKPTSWQATVGFLTHAFYGGNLYWGGEGRYLLKYDLAGTYTQIYDVYPTGFKFCSVGQDNFVYAGTTNGTIIQVNTTTDDCHSCGDCRKSGTTNNSLEGVCCDGSYVYVLFNCDTGYYVTIVDLADDSKTYYYDGASNSSGSMFWATNNTWHVYLSTSGQFQCVSGGLSADSARTKTDYNIGYQSAYPIVNQDQVINGNGDLGFCDYEILFDDIGPWTGQPVSKLYYRTPVGVGDWQTINITFSTSPLLDIAPYRVLPIRESSGNVIVFGQSYTPMSKFDYINKEVSDYLGYHWVAPYTPIRTKAGGYFYGAYPNKLMHYWPDSAWNFPRYDYVAAGEAVGAETTNPSATLAQGGKDPHFIVEDANGLIWEAHYQRYVSTPYNAWVVWYDPSDGSTGTYGATVGNYGYGAKVHSRSIGVAANKSKVCIGTRYGIIAVFDVSTKALDRTIDLSSYTGKNCFCVESVAGNDMLVILTDDNGANTKIVSVDISDGTVNWDNDIPAGLPFGAYYGGADEYKCINMRLPLGPDGNYYLFIGTKLYALDTSGSFTDLGDLGIYGMISFAGLDLVINDPLVTSLKTVMGFYENLITTTSPLGIEGGQPGGMPGGKVDGI